VPVPPTGGEVIVPFAPLTNLAETNVVFDGVESVITNFSRLDTTDDE